MKQNVIVLDFDGLLTYPGFGDRILKPLIDQEREFWFWTLNHRGSVEKTLGKMGFADNAQNQRIIDWEAFNLWISRMIRINEMLESGDEPDRELGSSILRGFLNDSGIRSDEEGARRFAEKYKEYRGLTDKHYKYPPLLGEDNYLLVESDRASYDPLNRVFLRTDHSGQLDLARRGTYSLVLVPEHPDLWAPELAGSRAFKKYAPDVPFTPEEVMDELVPQVLNWDGQHVVRDLSAERGLFEKEGSVGQERVLRRSERQ